MLHDISMCEGNDNTTYKWGENSKDTTTLLMTPPIRLRFNHKCQLVEKCKLNTWIENMGVGGHLRIHFSRPQGHIPACTTNKREKDKVAHKIVHCVFDTNINVIYNIT